jgi:hypothetical protein
MILRLRTKQLRFIYTFASGHQLIGKVEGDYFPNSPDWVFNLRSLNAVCLDAHGRLLMSFDEVFGQIKLDPSEAILSGSQSEQSADQGSFFSFNYRNDEATIYDATTDTWIANGWHPDHWQISELTTTQGKAAMTRRGNTAWANKAIA